MRVELPHRPGRTTRGIAIDWTAWGGIGMATRGSIPKMMELAGIDMLPPEAGIPSIRRELTAGGQRGEVVVGGRASASSPRSGTQRGGLDAVAVDATPAGPMVGRVIGMGVDGGLAVETTLDPAAQPFLDDHRIDGTPVLPGVMGIEAFAEVAPAAAARLARRRRSRTSRSSRRSSSTADEPRTLHRDARCSGATATSSSPTAA